MRPMLVSMLAVLGLWAIPANARPQAGLPASPASENGYLAHPSTNRLFFFSSDQTKRAVAFGQSEMTTASRPLVFRPAQATATGGFARPYFVPDPLFHNPVLPSLKLSPTGLMPAGVSPQQKIRRIFRPEKARLYFFAKP